MMAVVKDYRNNSLSVLGARRVVVLGALFMFAVVACGDDSSGADPERFCEIDAEMDQLGDPFELPPDEAREVVREGTNLIDESVRVAPDEIRPTVEMWGESFRAIIELFEAADFDVARIDDADVNAAFEAAFSGESGEAFEAAEEWIAANCQPSL